MIQLGLRLVLAQLRVYWAYNRYKAKLEKPKVCLFVRQVHCRKAISNQLVFDVACVQACPYDTLKLATLLSPVATGSPYFTARDIPCEMCEDIPCVVACPSGALDPKLTDIDDARMGTAVLIDHETCLNWQGLRCDVCYRVCPLIDEAITLEMVHNDRTGYHAKLIPTVNSEVCTGCGKCEQACVLDVAAIKVVPTDLAKGKVGSHYNFGWKEIDKPLENILPSETPVPEGALESLKGGK
ncbi:ferredoxin-type protein NapG [Vibrio alginolyticus]|nr:ferredoxin-type protein NapG [Vibrio alginolyticus]MCS0162578.1 ferredoxin-type protein NapG [Vibrio alginolyticus]